MDIIKKVTKDAERLLKSLRANYFIELPNGDQIWHGLEGYELRPSEEEEKPQRKKRETRTGLPFGAISGYYRPFLDKCKQPGDVAEIPFGQFEPEHLRGAIAAYCSTYWGKGTYTSVTNRVKKQVEVMRTSASQAKEHKPKTEGHSKVNGSPPPSKFRTVGHGMDALQNLQFDDPEQK